jgi:hypothetical protein
VFKQFKITVNRDGSGTEVDDDDSEEEFEEVERVDEAWVGTGADLGGSGGALSLMESSELSEAFEGYVGGDVIAAEGNEGGGVIAAMTLKPLIISFASRSRFSFASASMVLERMTILNLSMEEVTRRRVLPGWSVDVMQ